MRVACVEDGQREPFARPRDQGTGAVVRVPGSGRDDDLVGREGRQGVCDREQGISVADPAFDMRCDRPEPVDQRPKAPFCAATSRVLVGDPASKPGVVCGRDDDHVGVG